MRSFIYFCITFLILTLNSVSAQDLRIFNFEIQEDTSLGFVSLSDDYAISENPDSPAIPSIDELGPDSSLRIELSGMYRKLFMKGTGISESDKMYIYNYAENQLSVIPLMKLKVIALLNFYRSADDWPYSQEDYRIGFEIPINKLNSKDKLFSERFVYIGKSNPFSQNQLINITWNKIDPSDLPAIKLMDIDTNYSRIYEFLIVNYQYFKTGNRAFYLLDYQSEKNVFANHFIVIDATTKAVIFQKIYYSGESAQFAEPDYQWTGSLFKNKPDVLLGLQWHAFGCPEITFLDPDTNPVYVHCDNRH